MSAETSQTLDRGLRLLSLLAEPSPGWSVTDLAGRLGISRPAVYRLLATLEAHGMVTRGGDGQVRLGLGVLPLAQAVSPLLEQVAAPLLRQLAEEMGATAHLTVAEPGSAGEAVAVAVVEPSRTDWHVAYRVGSRHPLGRGAAGRAILSARHGGNCGPYVVTEGELQPGAIGIAAPVLGVAGLEASVGLVAIGPVGGPGTLDPVRAGPRVVATAAALATALRS
jgi:DNA-binding IclR family transcriptional regulator